MKAEAGGYAITGGRIGGEFVPAGQIRDWKQRWEQIQESLARLRAPLSGPMDGKKLEARRNELHMFYVQCYHLKDALKREDPNGVAPKVESAITTSSALALLADLANLDKHSELTKAPRSGTVPSYGELSARTDDGDAGWVFGLEVIAGGTTHDGIDIAIKAVDAWKQELTGWGLI